MSSESDSLSSRVDGLYACSNELTALTSDLSGSLNDLSGRVNDLSIVVDSFDSRINNIEEKIDCILSLLQRQDPIQQRLDRHITFIEKVYTRFKGVLSYLSWRSSPAELELEHKEEEVCKLHDLV